MHRVESLTKACSSTTYFFHSFNFSAFQLFPNPPTFSSTSTLHSPGVSPCGDVAVARKVEADSREKNDRVRGGRRNIGCRERARVAKEDNEPQARSQMPAACTGGVGMLDSGRKRKGEEEGEEEEAVVDKQRATLLPDRVNYGTISSGRYISFRHRSSRSVFFPPFALVYSLGPRAA